MSITEELREYTGNFYLFRYKDVREKLDAIADRIDAEHEAQLSDAFETRNSDENLESDGWVRLPMDADGETVYPRDLMVSAKGHFAGCHEVKKLVLVKCDGRLEWSCQLDGVGLWDSYFALGNLRHHHAPTVEDVLEELLQRFSEDGYEGGMYDLIAEYAAKLRLAGDDE